MMFQWHGQHLIFRQTHVRYFLHGANGLGLPLPRILSISLEYDPLKGLIVKKNMIFWDFGVHTYILGPKCVSFLGLSIIMYDL